MRKRRLDVKLLQSEVAQRVGVTECCVWNWENNTTTPTFTYWAAILDFLGYNPLPAPEGLSQELVLYRKLRNLTQKKVAHRLGIDPGTLGRWERGERKPTGRMLKLVEAFLMEANR